MTVRTHPQGTDGELLDTVFIDEKKSLSMVLRNPKEYNSIVVHTESGEITEPAPEAQTPSTPASTAQSAGTSSEQTATQQSAIGSTADESATNTQRGFFSNGANEPEALSNPMNLTIGGFLLSVAGIVFQMVGGN
jgi:hypothetical protein